MSPVTSSTPAAKPRTFRRVKFTTTRGNACTVYFRPGKKVFHAELSGRKYASRVYEKPTVDALGVVVSGITPALATSLNALKASPFLRPIPTGSGKLQGYTVRDRNGASLGTFYRSASKTLKAMKMEALATARRTGGTVHPLFVGAQITR